MCSHAITITNKTLNYVQGIDRYFLSVPCGNCDSCRLEKQSGWFLRTLFQFKEYPYALFYTLTYDDKHLPYFCSNIYPKFRNIPCFRHEDIKSLLDCLRTYLFRKKLINKNDFKFIICSEYGKSSGSTFRPHYHALFFFRKEIPYRYFHDLIRKFWGDRFGFVFPDIKCTDKSSAYYKNNYPNKSDVVVNSSVNCGKYVSKYICKDIDFFQQPLVSAFLNRSRMSDDMYQACLCEIRPYMPKHWQSRGFGIKLLDEVNSRLDYYLLGGKYHLLADLNGSEPKTYKIPDYIMNKVKYVDDISLDPTYKKRFFTKRINGEKVTIANPCFVGCKHQDRRKFIRTRRYSDIFKNFCANRFTDVYQKTFDYFSECVKNVVSSQFAKGKSLYYLSPFVKDVTPLVNFHLFYRGRAFDGVKRTLQSALIEFSKLDIKKFFIALLDKPIFSRTSVAVPQHERIFDVLPFASDFVKSLNLLERYSDWLYKTQAKELMHLQEFYKDLKRKKRLCYC